MIYVQWCGNQDFLVHRFVGLVIRQASRVERRLDLNRFIYLCSVCALMLILCFMCFSEFYESRRMTDLRKKGALVPDILPWDLHSFLKRILKVYDIVTADYL